MSMRLAVPIVVVAAAAAVVCFFLGGDDPSPAAPSAEAATSAPPAPPPRESASLASPPAAAPAFAPERAAPPALAAVAQPTAAPASYLAALGTLVGRVVDHDHRPLAGLPLELLGGLVFDLLPAADAWFEATPPDVTFVAARAVTDADGRFRIEKLEPQGLFLLQIDPRGPRATFRVVDTVPSPGETADLGDLVLDPYAVLLGRAVDEDQRPIPGARVRASAIPYEAFAFGLGKVRRGAVAAGMLPAEATGGVARDWLTYEVPGWMLRFLDLVPYSTTTTAADGTFRLEGVTIGSVTLLLDRDGYVPLVRGPINTSAGGEKDLGDLELDTGETLAGRVVDGKDEPVANAAIVAGEVLDIWPAAVLLPSGRTDADGRFSVPGLPARTHAVAARAEFGSHWKLLTEVEPGLDEPTLRLEDTYAVTVIARNADGEIEPRPDVMVQRKEEFGASPLLVPPLPAQGRTAHREDGATIVSGLAAAEFQVRARVKGYAVAKAVADLRQGSATVDVTLVPEVTAQVQVVAAGSGVPVEYALVSAFGEPTEEDPMAIAAPLVTRRTDGNGVASIPGLEHGTFRVRVLHPSYALGEADLVAPGPPLVVELHAGGTIAGRVLKGGLPPEESRMIAVIPDLSDAASDAELPLPRLTATAPDGTFRMTHVRAGPHKLVVARRLTSQSFGGGGPISIFGSSVSVADEPPDSDAIADEPGTERVSSRRQVRAGSDGPGTEAERDVVVEEGEETWVDIDVDQLSDDLPKARLVGRVLLNGRPAPGFGVNVKRKDGQGSERSATTKESGLFDCGEVPAGELQVAVFGQQQGALAVRDTTLQPGDVGELEFAIATATLGGRVVAAADHRPLQEVRIQIAQEAGENAGDIASAELATATEADGSFAFAVLPRGTYTLIASKPGFAGVTQRGVAVVAGGGAPLALELKDSVTVSGVVELPAGVVAPPYMMVHFVDQAQGEGISGLAFVNSAQRSFEVKDVAPGHYRVRVYAGELDLEPVELDVPDQGFANVTLQPKLAQEK